MGAKLCKSKFILLGPSLPRRRSCLANNSLGAARSAPGTRTGNHFFYRVNGMRKALPTIPFCVSYLFLGLSNCPRSDRWPSFTPREDVALCDFLSVIARRQSKLCPV